MLPEGLQYFASSDGALDHQVTPAEFETSLFYNILFGSSKLVMPDVFFFNCPPLLEHLDLTPGRMPFFTQALQKNLIVPAFRSKEVISFTGSLKELGIDQIRGVEGERFDLARAARILDNNYPDDKPPAIWQNDMGGRFERLAERVFNKSSEHITNPELRQLWEATRDWRLRGIEGARRLTRSLGGTGLRRAEIWNYLGRWLEILDQDNSFNKPAQFVDAVGKKFGPQYAMQAEFIVDITNLCYQLNQAGGLEINDRVSEPNVPRVLSRPAAAIVSALADREKWAHPTHIFDHTVRVPKVTALRSADSVRLLAVRDGEQGQSYRNFRNEWVINPSEENASKLQQAADLYVSAIRDVAEGPRENTRIVQLANAGLTIAGGAAGYMVGSLGTLVNPHPEYALVTSLAGAGAGASALIKNVRSARRLPIQDYDIRIKTYLKPAEYVLPADQVKQDPQ